MKYPHTKETDGYFKAQDKNGFDENIYDGFSLLQHQYNKVICVTISPKGFKISNNYAREIKH